MTYEVFKRKAYKRVDGRYVPHPDARRTVLRRGILTIAEAREFVGKAGPYSYLLFPRNYVDKD
jgi:hypothetical protein